MLKKLTLLVFVLVFVLSSVAQAQTPRDSGGRLPLSFSCEPAKGYVGYYWWERARGSVRGHIVLNYCLLRAHNAGPHDLRAVYQHELAHAHGKEHWQGTPATNAAYYPYSVLCHC